MPECAADTDVRQSLGSPSTATPNYFYSWVRDAALTMKVAISQPTLDNTLVQNYANAAYLSYFSKMETSKVFIRELTRMSTPLPFFLSPFNTRC